MESAVGQRRTTKTSRLGKLYVHDGWQYFSSRDHWRYFRALLFKKEKVPSKLPVFYPIVITLCDDVVCEDDLVVSG